MKVLNKIFIHIMAFFLVACSAKNPSGYEKVEAVVTASNGNLYILTETLDYEFPKSRIKDIKLFFELAPTFSEINQPISSRMWVKERSVDFSFDEATLRIQKEDNHKFSRNDSNLKDSYTANNKAKKFLKHLEKMVKQDRSGKLAIKRENNQENITDYNFITNKKVKNDNIRGRIVDIAERQKIIEEYKSNPDSFKDYRINIFYEPSLFTKNFFGKKIDKRTIISESPITLGNWKTLPTLKIQ
ncbi:hypothetical protein [Glaesserella sp.]|uniref:hypothetical protein n=1 Tax=Glaesserella sp. TaxID=2094731 RepID=UPI00359FA7FC